MNPFVAHRQYDRSIHKTGPHALPRDVREARFARWERVGVELVRADLRNGGRFIVGGSAQTRALAEEWVKRKDAEKAESERTATEPDTAELPVVRSLRRIGSEIAGRVEQALRVGLHRH